MDGLLKVPDTCLQLLIEAILNFKHASQPVTGSERTVIVQKESHRHFRNGTLIRICQRMMMRLFGDELLKVLEGEVAGHVHVHHAWFQQVRSQGSRGQDLVMAVGQPHKTRLQHVQMEFLLNKGLQTGASPNVTHQASVCASWHDILTCIIRFRLGRGLHKGNRRVWDESIRPGIHPRIKRSRHETAQRGTKILVLTRA